jgi:hypothetical protein
MKEKFNGDIELLSFEFVYLEIIEMNDCINKSFNIVMLLIEDWLATVFYSPTKTD